MRMKSIGSIVFLVLAFVLVGCQSEDEKKVEKFVINQLTDFFDASNFEGLKTYEHKIYRNDKLYAKMISVCGSTKVRVGTGFGSFGLKKNFITNVATVFDEKNIHEKDWKLSKTTFEDKTDPLQLKLYNLSYQEMCKND